MDKDKYFSCRYYCQLKTSTIYKTEVFITKCFYECNSYINYEQALYIGYWICIILRVTYVLCVFETLRFLKTQSIFNFVMNLEILYCQILFRDIVN